MKSQGLKIAKSKVDGRMVGIESVQNGLKCNCVCVKCGEDLEAMQGEVRDHYFRHSSKKNCVGSIESALHALCKQILIENTEIILPDIGRISYHDPLTEQKVGDFRSDVSAKYLGQDIHFEIRVTHEVGDPKKQFFNEKDLKCVEIDLSSELNSSYEVIQKKVLEAIDNKKIIHWEKEVKKDSKSTDKDNFWVLILVVAIIWGIKRLVFNRPLRNRR